MGNTQVGILVSVVALTGALFTIPVGILTDRYRRTWMPGGQHRRSVWWAVRYVLRVRTNVVIILASALGYRRLRGVEQRAGRSAGRLKTGLRLSPRLRNG